jgi:hypothetical protein
MSNNIQNVYLSSGGKIFEKNMKPGKGGLLCSLSNYSVKGHIWKITKLAFHRQSGAFITADERGQILFFSTSSNTYYSLRMASFPISSLEFIHSRPSNIIAAYHHGIVVIVDTISKDIVANIRPRGSDAIHLIKCHPSKPLCVMVASTGLIHLYDIKYIYTYLFLI